MKTISPRKKKEIDKRGRENEEYEEYGSTSTSLNGAGPNAIMRSIIFRSL